MPDAKTALSDVIVPSKFLPYMIERTATLSAFVRSGIVQRTPQFDALAEDTGAINSGALITMPFWTDLTTAAQILSDTVAATTNKITGSADYTAKQGRQTAYSANSLVPLLADGDPLAAVAQLVGEYWAREDQRMLISMLKGIFLAASMSTNLSSILTEDADNATDANCINGDTLLDAFQVLGDAKSKLTGIACHSEVENYLNKLEEVITIPESKGEPELKTWRGKQLIIDDSLPKRAGTTSGSVYRTYLFGAGAFAWGEKNLADIPIEGGFGSYGQEMSRAASLGDTNVFFRRIFLMHPRGVKWTASSVAASFPTNAELETGANWTKVYETKNVRIVGFDHNIGA